MSRPIKRLAIALVGIAALLLIAAGALIVVIQTGWFKNKVRERIISVTEKATGGRVEIGAFDYDWRGLTAQVAPFVVHGSEPASGPPFFRAGKIQIGLKIISAFEKQVDILSLVVEKPRVYVVVAADGSTNVPSPKPVQVTKNLVEQLLDLKVQHFEIRDGLAEYNSQKIPLDVRGDNLRVSMNYQHAGPRYVGEISSHQIHLSSPSIQAPLTFDFDAKLALERNSIQILETRLGGEGWKASIQGSLTDLSSPRASFDVTASASVKDLKKTLALPIDSRGELAFAGKGSIASNPFQYRLDGKITARELGYSYKDVAVRNIAVSSRLEMTPDRISLASLDVAALNGHFRGSAQVQEFKKLHVQGTAEGFSLRDLANLGGRESGELNGILSGPVRLDGTLARSGISDLITEAQLEISPGAGGVPVQGHVTIGYDQRAGQIQFGSSELNLGATNIAASGTLGASMAVRVTSKNLDDALALFPLLGQTPPEQLPLTLHNGVATASATIAGPLANPRVSGNLDLSRFALDRREFDHATATFDLDQSSANFRSFTLEQGKMRVEGQGRLSLQNWKLEDASTVSALLSLQNADLHTLAEQSESQVPITGSVSATLHVSGTFESPLLNGSVELQNVTMYDEHFDSVRGDIIYTATALEVSNGQIRSGSALITVSGAYNHPASDWKDGSLRFEIGSNRVTLAQIKHVQDFRKGLGGEVELKGSGTAKVVKGSIDLTSLNGQLVLHNAMVDGRAYGDLQLTANTRLPVLTLTAAVSLGGIQVQAKGDWRMEGDYPGQARIQIPHLPFATLHDLAPGQHLRTELPFEGFLEGEATISGPLNRPSAMKADIILSTLQMNARPNAKPSAGAQPQDLVLRNAQPIRLEATTKGVDIRNASFTAKDTTLEASGRLAFDSKNPWDLSAQGRINLSILQIFNPDLLAAGTSVINVAVRGPLMEPQVDGRLELRNASLFLRDFPNGVDQANGLILFDRNRATVQTLTAVTGGGDVKFEPGSFVGFRGTHLIYRLQGGARNVRYRSQDGVSITVNAALNLVGTSENSVLSGDVTVVRTGFRPRTDVGQLLAATAKPVSVTSTPNEYLRGIQFDVHIESARNLEVETTLTRNIQADANLRLRGTPERPVILGNITVGSGQIEFFGNKYTINRGEINFYNPAKTEPIIDMDLETKVRGIMVDISFSGSLNKLNFSYRSDPPLEANEIIALLAVGRVPSTAGPLASGQTTGQSYIASGNNALLAQAIAPVSGRLQKFFGVSHIKIDPQLTDVTSVPQARLTLEQQVSTDITLTYITNLAVTNQQIVRVEWDFSKQWSVVALRDANGAFGIDFQFRKRFK